MVLVLNLPEDEYRRYAQYYRPYIIESTPEQMAALDEIEGRKGDRKVTQIPSK